MNLKLLKLSPSFCQPAVRRGADRSPSRWIVSFLSLLAGLLLLAPSAEARSEGLNELALLPVQDNGRIKPFETFARESLHLIYGRENYRSPGRDGQESVRRVAMEVVPTWMMAGDFWDQQPIVEVKLKALKDALGLEATRDHYTPFELFKNPRLQLVFQELAVYRESKKKLDPYNQAASRLESQLGVYQGIKDATWLRVLPPTPEVVAEHAEKAKEGLVIPDAWTPVASLEGDLKEKFAKILSSYVQALPNREGVVDAQGSANLKDAVLDFKKAAHAVNADLYPSLNEGFYGPMRAEVHYETFHPFMWAWIIYLLSALAMTVAWNAKSAGVIAKFYSVSWALAGVAFLIHTYGFGLRTYLTGRPPVSNMYETVVWVSWGTILFAMYFEWKYRSRYMLLAGALVAVFCNIVSDLSTHILDGTLQPLEPVLRSNLWLIVHVLTITISYSAFFLAWALANFGLTMVFRGDSYSSPRVRDLVQACYRSLQIGVVLLAAGTILGGVWADYSWGRFWGWDPKETWALIALLGYLAILHARLVGLIRERGMLVGSIVAFNLVIMAWYGVNFVLGAGLHSYGFGAGGVEYVTAFVLLNLAYVGVVEYVLRDRKASE